MYRLVGIFYSFRATYHYSDGISYIERWLIQNVQQQIIAINYVVILPITVNYHLFS